MSILSKRMEAVASMVTKGNILADIGTDHGYVPIALVKEKRIPSAIAMDLRPGPLERANKHIAQFGLTEYIQTRLSDGVAALEPGEAQTILVAGMGGELVIHILTAGSRVCRAAKELILQPQSDLYKVRRFLRENDYSIVAEDMVFEDGKYYPMMKVIPRKADITDDQFQEIYDQYGPILIRTGNQVLCRFLDKQHMQLQTILKELTKQADSDGIVSRREEVQKKIVENEKAQKLALRGRKHAGV